MTTRRSPGLGRGLGALIPTGPAASDASGANGAQAAEPAVDLRDPRARLAAVPGVTLREIAVADIAPNPRQPRTVFDEDALAELAHSLTEVGFLQPVVVRPVGDSFELVAGERRWRAAQVAGMSAVPALVRDTQDEDLLRDALLENLHRVQLNPLEEAAAYQQLLTDFGCTQDELANRLGRSRPAVTNSLRLLKLPASVQRRVAAGVLSAGHARAIAGLPDDEAMELWAKRVVAEGMSVRALEEALAMGEDAGPKRRRRRRAGEGAFQHVADDLSDRLDTRVKVTGSARGRISIEFASADDLQRILDALKASSTWN